MIIIPDVYKCDIGYPLLIGNIKNREVCNLIYCESYRDIIDIEDWYSMKVYIFDEKIIAASSMDDASEDVYKIFFVAICWYG